MNACDAWCTCTADSSPDDAGGYNGCLGYLNCVIACVNGDPDAGIAPDDGGIPACSQICGGDASPYTANQQTEGLTLIGALAGSCLTQCQ